MFRFVFLIGGLLIGTLKLESQTLNALHFPTAKTGVVVGNAGLILKTTNGGSIWTPKVSGTTRNFSSVYFPDVNRGYAVADSFMFRTTDGGETWNSSILPCRVLYFHFPTSDTGYAGLGTCFIRTFDGGLRWDSVPKTTGNGSDIQSLFFTNGKTGFIAGNNTLLKKTTDAGTSWQKLMEQSPANVFGSIYFPSASTGYVCTSFPGEGSRGKIFKTLDAGLIWSLAYSSYRYFRQIEFPTINTGYIRTTGTPAALGRGPIMKTTDGGINWFVPAVDSAGFDYIRFPHPDTGYALLSGSSIWKTADGGVHWTLVYGTTSIHSESFIHNAIFTRNGLFKFRLPRSSFVQISLFDLRGNRVEDLVNATLPPGEHQIELKKKAKPGLYFLDIYSNGLHEKMKIFLGN